MCLGLPRFTSTPLRSRLAFPVDSEDIASIAELWAFSMFALVSPSESVASRPTLTPALATFPFGVDSHVLPLYVLRL